jgi:hypothetical protein
MAWFGVALGPFIRRFERLSELWREFNKGPAEYIRGLAGDVRGWTASRASLDAQSSMRFQQNVAGSVQGTVDRAAEQVNRFDRMLPGGPGVTINANNTFLQANGEVQDSLASAYRRAQLSVAGGAR